MEQEVPGHIVLTAGYAGSRSSHLLEFGNNINVGSPSACGTVSGYTLGCGPNGSAFGVPYPAFAYSTIDNIYDAGKASYNSLQIKAETKSERHGIYALIGYTYSRAYDTGLTDGLGSIIGATYFPLPNWQTLDWGLSQINLNQNFTASVIYDLPFGKGKKWGSSWNGAANAILGGWELTVIEKATSGFPSSSSTPITHPGPSWRIPMTFRRFVPIKSAIRYRAIQRCRRGSTRVASRSRRPVNSETPTGRPFRVPIL
jgi:hypothetical protein